MFELLTYSPGAMSLLHAGGLLSDQPVDLAKRGEGGFISGDFGSHDGYLLG
jgi:hypothetical protein